ncbi:HEAT repeat domain-containing protein [Chryseobacterium sp. FH1]|uniref:HEAT repeat domain-containing protein n=1 Tax=Chryseobacterium sp. FH1 TaxID=1233951 RepID=UPI0004E31E73|nr:HEAT repeat domain-containing protein [Chryseobacterium sp. FH1]KFC20291.1 hypothetical protein IO90_14020 [Chryseobacterium sp. FH1]
MTDPLKKYIQDHREEFDTIEAPDEMFDKIMSKMENSTPPVAKSRSIISWKNYAIAASITIILSLGIFNLWQKKEVDKTVFVKQTPKKEQKIPDEISIPHKEIETSEKQDNGEQNSKQFLAKTNSYDLKKGIQEQNSVPNYNIEEENHFEKANAIDLMDNQFSASSRLQGIALIKNLPDYDANIIDILSEKAISDENTNVRLAAISALEIQRQNPAVKDRIQQIFVQQNDPMVEKELISLLAEKHSSELSSEVNIKLLALAKNPTTVAFVKDEAYSVIMKF